MTFDLVRAGWPNAVAILALAVMPFVSLAIPAESSQPVVPVESAELDVSGATLAALSTDAQ